MNTLRRLTLLIAGLVLLPTSQHIPTAQQQETDGYELVFQEYDGSAIYRINLDTLEKTTIVQDTRRYNRSPNVLLSPDGEWVFFYRQDSIWRASRDGSIVEPIMPQSTDQAMIGFSADGRYFMFEGNTSTGKWHIFRLPMTGGAPVDLTPDYEEVRYFNWLSGQQRLLFWDDSSTYCLDLEGNITRIGDRIIFDYWQRSRPSPDGEWVGLPVILRNETDTAIMRPDCTGFRPLLDPMQFGDSWISDWTPDSQWLLVTASSAEYSGKTDIYRIRPDGSGLQNLTATPGINELVATLAPDAEWLYLEIGFLPRKDGLHRIRLDGTERQILLDHYRDFLGWSHDRDWLIFTADYEDRQGLFRIAPDGSVIERLAGPFESISGIRFSPDGQWLMLTAAREGIYDQLFRLRPDGRDFEQLTAQPEPHNVLGWSPDEKWLIFYTWGHGTGDGPHYYRMRPDGTERAFLANASLVGWLPPSSSAYPD